MVDDEIKYIKVLFYKYENGRWPNSDLKNMISRLTNLVKDAKGYNVDLDIETLDLTLKGIEPISRRDEELFNLYKDYSSAYNNYKNDPNDRTKKIYNRAKRRFKAGYNKDLYRSTISEILSLEDRAQYFFSQFGNILVSNLIYEPSEIPTSLIGEINNLYTMYPFIELLSGRYHISLKQLFKNANMEDEDNVALLFYKHGRKKLKEYYTSKSYLDLGIIYHFHKDLMEREFGMYDLLLSFLFFKELEDEYGKNLTTEFFNYLHGYEKQFMNNIKTKIKINGNEHNLEITICNWFINRLRRYNTPFIKTLLKIQKIYVKNFYPIS